ncbi:MAG: hypothetical protein IPP35_10480 [Elusimicrobia bacterium]|nr:hypothetical protein [Elusimicrobiota bacterium]
MASEPDYFDGIRFDREWEEEDWERFFDAQDRLSSDLRRKVGSPPERPSADPALTFRGVLRQFGMDPDNPEASPRPFALDQVVGPDGAVGLPFWHPGADHERLPLYLQAAEFHRQSAEFVEIRFAKMLAKTYKSASYRQFQKVLPEIEDRARAIPRLIALGHRVGYDPFGAKGNIVRCRRALEHAESCVSLLSRLPRRHMDRDLYQRFFADGIRLRNGLLDWILLLRTRFAARSNRRP